MRRRQRIILVAGLLGLLGCAATSRREMREGYIPLAEGGRLYYQVSGSGSDTVVVLHGGPGLHGRYLDEALAPLATDHVLINYDQRGRGRSDFPSDSLSLSATQDVDDLEAVRTFFRLARLKLIGHGWGGGLAALYAMRHPDRVARLVLISPILPRATYLWNLTFQRAAGRDTNGLDGLMEARTAGADRADPHRFCRRYWGALLSPAAVRDRRVIRRLGPAVCDAPPAALARVELINRRILGSLGTWNWPEQLATVPVPVLVIQGVAPRDSERDEGSTWLGGAREWVASLPEARLQLVGTVPQFPWLDAGSKFDETVRQFLDLSRESSDARD